jgi:hypothetical protein
MFNTIYFNVLLYKSLTLVPILIPAQTCIIVSLRGLCFPHNLTFPNPPVSRESRIYALRPGPSPTLGSFGLSHPWRHKPWVSLRGPPCAHGVMDTYDGEVHNNDTTMTCVILGVHFFTSSLVIHHSNTSFQIKRVIA